MSRWLSGVVVDDVGTEDGEAAVEALDLLRDGGAAFARRDAVQPRRSVVAGDRRETARVPADRPEGGCDGARDYRLR